jgi:hypothetical protein
MVLFQNELSRGFSNEQPVKKPIGNDRIYKVFPLCGFWKKNITGLITILIQLFTVDGSIAWHVVQILYHKPIREKWQLKRTVRPINNQIIENNILRKRMVSENGKNSRDYYVNYFSCLSSKFTSPL